MKLADQLGTLGDHAYRAAAYLREPDLNQDARTQLSLALLLIESIAPQLRERLGIRQRAEPIPPAPKPPKPPPTVGEDMKELKRELAAKRSTARKPDPTPDEIAERSAMVRGARARGAPRVKPTSVH